MWDIRLITEDDADLFRARLARGFGYDEETEDDDARRRFNEVFEFDRTFAAFDADDIVGTGGAFSFDVTVPGGAAIPMAGTTVITVQPTHRRQGLLRSLMERHLDEVRERGDALAGLWASEATIYGRFGFGVAAYRNKIEIDSGTTRLRGGDIPGQVTLVEPADAEPLVQGIYEQARLSRPGMLSRSTAWWEHRRFYDDPNHRGGKSSLRYAIHEMDGEPTGYVTYRQKGKWEDFVSSGEVSVGEMITVVPEARRALWGFLVGIDLYTTVEWWNAPADEPLWSMVEDHRRVRRSIHDNLWLKVMDVPRALQARRYGRDGTVRMTIHDPAEAVSGTYELEVVQGEASCAHTDAPPDVTMSGDVLSHLYLGSGSPRAMADAGRIAGSADAVSALGEIFRWDRAAWCPEVF